MVIIGGIDYKDLVDIFSNVKEIGYEKNIGVGYARQYGIDHTKEDFIVFIVADETFYESSSLALIAKPMKDTSAKFVISHFVQMGKEIGQQAPVPANLV